MTEQQVPAVHTPVSLAALAAELRLAVSGATGAPLQRPGLLVLCAHVWHETDGGARCYCWNLAGIKHVPGDGVDYAVLHTFEYIGQPPHRIDCPAQFRAWQTLSAGVAAYVALLRGRFGFCWPAVESGDPADFAHRLRARGYYTAPEADYAAAMVRRVAEIAPLLEEDTVPDRGALAVAREQALAASVAEDERPTAPELPEA
jgi:hypothetical protein